MPTLRPTVPAAALLLLISHLAAAGAFAGPEEPRAQPGARPAAEDFVVIGLPTTRQLPARGLAVRITHRFTRPLNEGSFGDLASDLFGIDGGARIGLELRYGLRPGLQAGIHRTSDRTIQLFGQYTLVAADEPRRLAVDLVASVQGLDNFSEEYSPAIGAAVSYAAGGRAVLYAAPLIIGRANPLGPDLTEDDRHAMLLGLGARVHLRPSVAVVGEVSPRIAGYDPGAPQGGIGIEKRTRRHVFQLSASNGLGTTLTQIARGGPAESRWFLGFNITRTFGGRDARQGRGAASVASPAAQMTPCAFE